MSDLLDHPLVVLYFQPEANLKRANAELVSLGMQGMIEAGERVLYVDSQGSVNEMRALSSYKSFHPNTIRLPDKYQTDQVRVTCPDCKFTYTHQHIFSEGTK